MWGGLEGLGIRCGGEGIANLGVGLAAVLDGACLHDRGTTWAGAEDSPAFIAELRKKLEHYLAFLRYPEPVRRVFSTTKAVKVVNGQLETMRRNNGGYFSTADNLEARLGIAIERLENGKWSRVVVFVSSARAQLGAMLVARFEGQT